ncbi:MAG: hypothetical protein M1814_005574 [Vezdaea aestivalis]|nr:MAG: hypothetical protein M1814_005574 [Vezdaea aestivalis]
MGTKELDEHISNLQKSNFDLKLELYHRRQKTAALEEKLLKIVELETENEELQDINEQLLGELEKRDRAVEEAVALICELEEKVEVLEESMDLHRPPSPHPDQAPVPPSSLPPQKTPPLTPAREPTQPGTKVPLHLLELNSPAKLKTPSRTPSFLLSDMGGSVGALRSLYLEGENDSRRTLLPTLSKRGSLLTRESFLGASPEPDGLDSPRLSVLSEADFASVYGDTTRIDLEITSQMPNLDLNNKEDQKKLKELGEERDRRQTRAERLQRWMDERSSPSKTSRSPASPASSRFVSINDVLNGRNDNLAAPWVAPKPSLAGPIFGGGSPPRPQAKTSNSSIIAERSLLDGTPAPARTYQALQPSGRPRSAGTIDTRPSTIETRAGQEAFRGYETDYETEDSDGDGRSLLAERSDYDPPERQMNIGGLPVFSALDSRAMRMLQQATPSKSQLRERGYGGDMMFNGDGLAAVASSIARPRLPPAAPMPPPHAKYPPVSSNRFDGAPLSPLGGRSNSSKTATPSRHPQSPPPKSLSSYPSHEERSQTPPPAEETKRRFRVPKVSMTPSPTKRTSLKTRFFGRPNTTNTSPAEPVEGSLTHTSVFFRPLRPIGHFKRSNTTSQDHPPLSPNGQKRPGTAGSVETQARRLRGQHSGSTRGESSGAEGIWTPADDGRGGSFTSASDDLDQMSRSEGLGSWGRRRRGSAFQEAEPLKEQKRGWTMTRSSSTKARESS